MSLSTSFEDGRRTVSFKKRASNVVGSNIFNFANGDIYIGSYGITQQDILFKTGRGMYLCADGTVMMGDWDEDELVYGRIKYPNGVEYFGNLLFNGYQGNGIYKIPGAGNLVGSFSRNTPIQELTLVDINGFTWRGKPSGNSAVLYPVNQFLESSRYSGNVTSVPKAPREELTELYRTSAQKTSKDSGEHHIGA